MTYHSVADISRKIKEMKMKCFGHLGGTADIEKYIEEDVPSSTSEVSRSVKSHLFLLMNDEHSDSGGHSL